MIGGKAKVSDLVIGARNMIEAADIRPGDSVLMLADRSSDGDSIDALAAALRLHGATPMEMIVEPILRYGDVPEAALRAMEAVDVAIWVWPVFLNGSTNYRERLRTPKEGDAGAPTERVKPYKIYFEGWPGLLATDYARFPNELLWTIARKVKAIVAAGSKVTISGPNGAKLVAEYDNKRIYAMQTKAGEPAGRCHFPWGRCGVYNGSGTANGTVQLDCAQGVPGMLREPMLWTIKDAKVVGVEGGGDIGAECKRLVQSDARQRLLHRSDVRLSSESVDRTRHSRSDALGNSQPLSLGGFGHVAKRNGLPPCRRRVYGVQSGDRWAGAGGLRRQADDLGRS